MDLHAAQTAPVERWTPIPQPPRVRHLRLAPPPSDDGPDRRWIERLTECIVEVLAGQRSPTTLIASVSPVVFHALRNPTVDTQLRGGKVLTLRVQPLGEDSIEVAAVVACTARTRAVALRLARRHDRWRCVCVGVL